MVSYKQNYPLDINKNSRKHVKVSNKHIYHEKKLLSHDCPL